MPWIQCEIRTRREPDSGRPELAGRDRELAEFEIVLERVARGKARTQHGPDRIARGGQDRPAECLQVDGDAAAVGDREDRGPA